MDGAGLPIFGIFHVLQKYQIPKFISLKSGKIPKFNRFVICLQPLHMRFASDEILQIERLEIRHIDKLVFL